MTVMLLIVAETSVGAPPGALIEGSGGKLSPPSNTADEAPAFVNINWTYIIVKKADRAPVARVKIGVEITPK